MRVVPNESQLTGPFIVDTARDFGFLVRGRAGVAIPVREAREKSAVPARRPVVNARRVNALETEDSEIMVAEFIRFHEVITVGFTAFVI